MSDGTVQIWDHLNGSRAHVLEGLAPGVACVRFTRDARFLAAMSGNSAIIWRSRDWEPVARLGDTGAHGIGRLDFHPSEPLLAVTNEERQRIDCYRLDYGLLEEEGINSDSRRYVNAKVMLLGDTGVGKSALGLVLSGQPYRPTDSTHGRNVWTFESREIDVPSAGAQTREVLLWDLAGQPGYRLVHQLHLNEVAVALVIFDARSETNPFSGVRHWVRALAQARRLDGTTAVPLRTYLVAARADRGGVAVTRERIQALLEDFDIDKFFETSAKENWLIEELAQAIRDGIVWESLPTVSSNVLFDSIRQFLLEEKEQGDRLLSTTIDLFRTFRRARPDMADREDLRSSFDACIGRAESRDLITRLHFGDLVLLQPELLDSYASAMVQAAKEEPDGLGSIPEEEALEGRFRLAETERVPDRAQEKLLLIATVEELLRHEIALKETTDRGVDLVFPSQFTREQPDAYEIPGKQAVFTFDGPLRNIYARLAVRLSHSALFKRRAMWQNTASYTAMDRGTCGIHLRELEEGRGELTLFYDDQASSIVRAQFETYVLEYLQLRALPGTVTRRRIRVCQNCAYVLPDDLIRRKLERGATTIRCPDCELSIIPLAGDELPITTDTAVAEMNRSADMRRDENIAATRLQGKIRTNDFDVFLCYNTKDREHVTAIGEQLKARGLLPWLDIWEIPPGSRWIQELQTHLKSVKSAAVFIGPQGPGPWQEMEVETLLRQFVRRKRPIIPVILEGKRGDPRFPDFLRLWQHVDMRNPDPDPFEQLVWGITRRKPASG
jgi:GTPase SAR1 family protein